MFGIEEFMTQNTSEDAPISGVHHIGLTVADRDAALTFWEGFLGKPARWSTLLDRPYLARAERLLKQAGKA